MRTVTSDTAVYMARTYAPTEMLGYAQRRDVRQPETTHGSWARLRSLASGAMTAALAAIVVVGVFMPAPDHPSHDTGSLSGTSQQRTFPEGVSR